MVCSLGLCFWPTEVARSWRIGSNSPLDLILENWHNSRPYHGRIWPHVQRPLRRNDFCWMNDADHNLLVTCKKLSPRLTYVACVKLFYLKINEVTGDFIGKCVCKDWILNFMRIIVNVSPVHNWIAGIVTLPDSVGQWEGLVCLSKTQLEGKINFSKIPMNKKGSAWRLSQVFARRLVLLPNLPRFPNSSCCFGRRCLELLISELSACSCMMQCLLYFGNFLHCVRCFVEATLSPLTASLSMIGQWLQATVASQMATSDCCVTNAFIEQWKGWFIFVSCCLIFFRNIIKPGSFLCSYEKTNNAVETFQIIVFDCLILNRFFRTWMIIGSFVREWLQTIVTYLSIAIRFSNRRFVATYVSLVRWDNCAGHPVGPALDFSTFITRHSKPSIYFMFNRICICNNFKKLKYLGKVLDFPNGSVCSATSHLLI